MPAPAPDPHLRTRITPAPRARVRFSRARRLARPPACVLLRACARVGAVAHRGGRGPDAATSAAATAASAPGGAGHASGGAGY